MTFRLCRVGMLAVVLAAAIATGCKQKRETVPPATGPAAQLGSTVQERTPAERLDPLAAQSSPAPLSQPTVKAKLGEGARGISDVLIKRDGKWVNLTRFRRPHHVYDYQASPDSRWMFVWHLDYTPRKVSVYDLETMKRVSRFIPGAGGTLRWTAHNTIYHQFGAGTNTAIFAVYGVDGREVWDGFTSGAELSPCGRYVITYPTTGVELEPIAIRDVRDGRILAQRVPKGISIVLGIQWVSRRSIRVRYGVEGPTDPEEHTIEMVLPPGPPPPGGRS